ncbi:malonyl-CoA O-methyltransferase [Variovorax boronicumulans]|uniref:biotin synthase n=1 Tax=Variovorax TaxID=34072 RepID=UPI0027825C74|nr:MULTISPECIES: biotin synthase [Variovorax]MDQ0038124.1 malonyl-CoA O-methyltransferase [Variovorax boronicumulans]MDQ0606213.1 malonyl-CoA O-methyltransferase [Variovorax sp. W1I1]
MATDPARRPPTIDPTAAARWRRLAPAEGSPWLHEEIGRRMEDRLQWIKAQPRTWADWAPLRGGLEAHELVARRYRDAASYVIEPEAALAGKTGEALAAPWWSARRWQGGKARFDAPPEDGVDLLWANMSLHMAADPEALISQWHKLVATDGFLMFSCLGPDTVRELRALHARLGWPAAGHEYTDMHDWGDMLVHAGFAEPVMDMERIVLTWATPEAALAELRTLGRNLHPGRFPALRGKAWHKALKGALPELAPAEGGNGHIALTFEVIYGHAFKPKPRVSLSAESAVSLREMRSMLQRGRPGA